jgi:hypothetical protein
MASECITVTVQYSSAAFSRFCNVAQGAESVGSVLGLVRALCDYRLRTRRTVAICWSWVGSAVARCRILGGDKSRV